MKEEMKFSSGGDLLCYEQYKQCPKCGYAVTSLKLHEGLCNGDV